jgi:hypothetical protein
MTLVSHLDVVPHCWQFQTDLSLNACPSSSLSIVNHPKWTLLAIAAVTKTDKCGPATYFSIHRLSLQVMSFI